MHEHAHIGRDLGELAAVYEPHIHLAVARRNQDPTAVAFVTEVLQRRCLPALELVVSPGEPLAASLSCALGRMGHALTTLPGYQAWCEDLQLQVDLFSNLFELDKVGMRLATLDGPMCPRFHVDHVPCRLITTYGGRGTEWLPEEHVDRSRLGCTDLPLRALAHDESICSIEPWAIALFRGEGWLGGRVGGIVHRSPHIGPETPRLLLTLDFVH